MLDSGHSVQVGTMKHMKLHEKQGSLAFLAVLENAQASALPWAGISRPFGATV
jgi:hypothetical protein